MSDDTLPNAGLAAALLGAILKAGDIASGAYTIGVRRGEEMPTPADYVASGAAFLAAANGLAFLAQRGGDAETKAETGGAHGATDVDLGEAAQCPKCGSAMWDNRLTKRNPKAPDYKCRDKACDGVIWPPKGQAQPGAGAKAPDRGGKHASAKQPVSAGAPGFLDDGPPPPSDADAPEWVWGDA